MTKKISSTGSETVTLPLKEYSELLEFKKNMVADNCYYLDGNTIYNTERFISTDEAIKILTEKSQSFITKLREQKKLIDNHSNIIKQIKELSISDFRKFRKNKLEIKPEVPTIYSYRLNLFKETY